MIEFADRRIDSTPTSAQVVFRSRSFNFWRPNVGLLRCFCVASRRCVTRAGSPGEVTRLESAQDARPLKGAARRLESFKPM
jgi:hypothetical protein